MTEENSVQLPALRDRATAWARTAFLPPAKSVNLKYLARSIVLEEAGPPFVVGAATTVIGVLVLAFLLWAAVVRLDETAAARGEILPENYVQPVQHLEGGIVAQILVKDGDAVEAGAPLVILDDTAFLADLERTRARHAALTYEVERLRAFALERPMRADLVSGHGLLRDDQLAILSTQIKARDAQVAVIDDQIDDRRKELSGLEDKAKMLERQVALVGETLDVRTQLLAKGLTSKLVYLDTMRELNRTRGELSDTLSQVARAKIAINEAKSRRLDIEARLRNQALDQMGGASSELAQIEEERRRLEDRVKRLAVLAPVAGTVKGLMVKSTGSVLAPGAQVAEIVPKAANMVAEIRVSPRDVGHIKPGTPALVKIETYDFGRYGGIKGEVSHVSAGSFLDEKGEPYFKGRVTLTQNHVGAAKLGNIVTPGMTLVADIKTGEKTLLGYLVRPVQRALSTAFSER